MYKSVEKQYDDPRMLRSVRHDAENIAAVDHEKRPTRKRQRSGRHGPSALSSFLFLCCVSYPVHIMENTTTLTLQCAASDLPFIKLKILPLTMVFHYFLQQLLLILQYYYCTNTTAALLQQQYYYCVTTTTATTTTTKLNKPLILL